MKPTNVDEYVATLPPEHATIVNELRSIIAKTAPKMNEAYKWAQPVFEWNGPAIWIKAYKSYVNIGFWRGAEMEDAHGLLEGTGDRMRHVKLANLKDIKKKALHDYIKQAVQLNTRKGDPTKGMNRKK